MSLTINANGFNQAEKNVETLRGKEGRQQGRTSFFAGNSNIAKDPVALKRKEAQQKAMKVVQDAWANDKSVDDSIESRRKHYKDTEARLETSRKELTSIREDESALQQIYEVSEDSKEQQDLELLKKRQDFNEGVISTPLTEEEQERLKEIDSKPLTEYQERALALNKRAGVLRKDIKDARQQMRDDVNDIKNIQLERLKSNPMVDAQNAADDIIGAANKEIIGMAVQEAKEEIDKKMEEEEEKAKDSAEDKEEKEEVLEAMQERRAIQEALVEGTKEAIEEAEARRRRNEAPDMEITEMIDITKTGAQTGDVQKSLQDIKNSMNLLEADLKGIKVDEEI